MVYDLIVIGGGAAGFFGAIQASEMNPDLRILIVEKTPKLLSKVRVSGGGRCNVTHSCFEATKLSTHYPRGERVLKKIFKVYQATDVVQWFENNGVALKAEADGRMFPITDDSQTVIDCLMEQAHRHEIEIESGDAVVKIEPSAAGFNLHLKNGSIYQARKVLVATGGSASPSNYDWLASLGIRIVPPIPSLFTFNDPSRLFKDLMGVSVADAEIKIAGTKLSMRGPVLITHWGLSGPAVIRLSAWAAIYLSGVAYKFTCLVSWIGPVKEDELRVQLTQLKTTRAKQKIWTNPLFNLPQRLWVRLCELAEIIDQKIWAELPQKNLNKLLENLIRCPFHISGKTTFKEEFVTCGGVDLSDVNPETMESNNVKGLFFAGEVLDIDGETGGFNFQAAWSTAFVAAKAIAGI
jgi:predicted Rossmann fold flavoprotein